ncbi:PAS domain-containing protein [Oryzifoliimicrobium ureilyticus]|uniref:PAS domain-containing protein n=1 Tax=Oryzifoliimicrobium ureilyticus TaxID=3113724 RepID=UPI00307624CF
MLLEAVFNVFVSQRTGKNNDVRPRSGLSSGDFDISLREIENGQIMSDIEIDPPLSDFFRQSSIALALARASDDHQLVLVNQQFCTLTGYSSDDVIDRNCRFLQTNSEGRSAENSEPREKLRAFLTGSAKTVRTPIVNFRKDGTPFVNLLFMSKLLGGNNKPRYIFASQFDISRSHPDLLQTYDRQLGDVIAKLKPLLQPHEVVLEGSLATIANSATTIAQAKVTLAELERDFPY